MGRPSSHRLGDKLGELLREIEARAAEAEQRRQQAAEEEAQRQRDWQAAMDRARDRLAESLRADGLLAQAASWRTANDIRAYCDAIEARHGDDPDTRGLGDMVSPPRGPDRSTLPTSPLAGDPRVVDAEQLRPFLDGWDPYRPQRRRW